MIQGSINASLVPNSSSKERPFIQVYSSLNIYGVECNKGLAFDNVHFTFRAKRKRNKCNVSGRLKMIILHLEN